MFELPEMTVLSQQMNATLRGKRVAQASLGNSPHKFVWYNRSADEFAELTRGKQVGEAYVRGRWLFAPLEPGYVLVFGECGGKMLLHAPGAPLPAKYHLLVRFEDGSFLTETTAMWGAMELYARGDECQREYIRDMRPYPTSPDFTFDYFQGLVEELAHKEKRSAKGLLTQEQIIPGLGNSCAQDILFEARLSPKHPIDTLDAGQVRGLYDAILGTVEAIIAGGGRNDETDLFGNPGGYQRKMDKDAPNRPCPRCGGTVKAMAYLGGTCYFCTECQS
jgi:formamidopyrimidine-DNA glycosylase